MLVCMRVALGPGGSSGGGASSLAPATIAVVVTTKNNSGNCEGDENDEILGGSL